MDGTKRTRFCSDCDKNVHNVETMTKRQVLAVLKESGGECCMRLTRRNDGSIVFDERALAQRALANVHAPLLALLSAAAVIATTESANAQPPAVPPGYSVVVIEAPHAANLPADTEVDIVWHWQRGEKRQASTIIRKAKIVAHPTTTTTVSVLVTEKDSEKLELAKQSTPLSFSIIPRLPVEQNTEIGDVSFETGLVSAGRGDESVPKESCMQTMDTKLKRLVRFCLEGGKWIRVPDPEVDEPKSLR